MSADGKNLADGQVNPTDQGATSSPTGQPQSAAAPQPFTADQQALVQRLLNDNTAKQYAKALAEQPAPVVPVTTTAAPAATATPQTIKASDHDQALKARDAVHAAAIASASSELEGVRKFQVESSLMAYAARAVNPAQAAQLTSGNVSFVDGKYEVRDPSGSLAISKSGAIHTPETYMAEFLDANPHLCKAPAATGESNAVQGGAPNVMPGQGGGNPDAKAELRAEFSALPQAEKAKRLGEYQAKYARHFAAGSR